MPSALEKKRVLDAAFSGQNMQVALLVDSPTTGQVTFDPWSDIVYHYGHDFVNGCRVRFSTTGSMDGISPSTTYRVVQASSSSYQLAIEANYNPITQTATSFVDIYGEGTGTHTCTEQPFEENLDFNVAQLVRKEVPSYQGSGRRQLNPAPAAISGNTASISNQIFPDIVAGNGPIIFRYTLFLIGGSTTRGNTSGSAVSLLDSGTRTIAQGSKYTAVWGGTQA